MYDYYSIQDVKLFDFFMIPKELIRNKIFASLSTDAKLLYGIMMERLTLSQKNGWVDDQGRVYIIYKIETLMDDMNCKNTKAFKLMKELESFQLIERKRQGLSRPNLIYVKNFAIPVDDQDENTDNTDKSTDKASVSADIRDCEGQDIREDSDVRERECLDIRKREGHDIRKREVQTFANANPNKNNNNKINNIIISSRGRAREEDESDALQLIMTGQICTDRKLVEHTLKTKLGYTQLVAALPGQKELMDQVFEVLIDLYANEKAFSSGIKINGMTISPHELRIHISGITEEKLYNLIKRLRGKEIINPHTYLINCIYNAVYYEDYPKQEEVTQSFFNLEQRDLYHTIQLLESAGGGTRIGCAV